MASELPLLAHYLFCYIEPALLAFGFLTTVSATPYFISSQLPDTKPHAVLATEEILAFQLGNLFLLIGFINVFVLQTTSELSVVRAYLSALWWGDLGHLGVTAWCLGGKGVVNLHRWSLVTWGNLGVVLLLFVARSLYFLGALGKSGVEREKGA